MGCLQSKDQPAIELKMRFKSKCCSGNDDHHDHHEKKHHHKNKNNKKHKKELVLYTLTRKKDNVETSKEIEKGV